MGAAGAKGFGPTLRGMNVKKASQNEGIQNEDGATGYSSANGHYHKDHQLIFIHAIAGQLDEGKDITHKMIDEVGREESQTHYDSSLCYSPRKFHCERHSTRDVNIPEGTW